MTSHQSRLFALAVAAAIVAIIVCANLGLADAAFALAGRVPGADVTWHFVLYCLLSLAVMSWRTAGANAGNPAWGTLLILALLVGSEELSQRWIPSRTFSLVDLFASFAGLAAGALLAYFLRLRIGPAAPGAG